MFIQRNWKWLTRWYHQELNQRKEMQDFGFHKNLFSCPWNLPLLPTEISAQCRRGYWSFWRWDVAGDGLLQIDVNHLLRIAQEPGIWCSKSQENIFKDEVGHLQTVSFNKPVPPKSHGLLGLPWQINMRKHFRQSEPEMLLYVCSSRLHPAEWWFQDPIVIKRHVFPLMPILQYLSLSLSLCKSRC